MADLNNLEATAENQTVLNGIAIDIFNKLIANPANSDLQTTLNNIVATKANQTVLNGIASDIFNKLIANPANSSLQTTLNNIVATKDNQIVLNTIAQNNIVKSVSENYVNGGTAVQLVYFGNTTSKMTLQINETANGVPSDAHLFNFRVIGANETVVGGFIQGTDEYGNFIKHGDAAYFNALFPAMTVGQRVVRTFTFINNGQFGIRVERVGANLPSYYELGSMKVLNH